MSLCWCSDCSVSPPPIGLLSTVYWSTIRLLNPEDCRGKSGRKDYFIHLLYSISSSTPPIPPQSPALTSRLWLLYSKGDSAKGSVVQRGTARVRSRGSGLNGFEFGMLHDLLAVLKWSIVARRHFPFISLVASWYPARLWTPWSRVQTQPPTSPFPSTLSF